VTLPATGSDVSTSVVQALFVSAAGALVISVSRRRRKTQG
jgi:LPXTG-motif cell wall-anchored protein